MKLFLIGTGAHVVLATLLCTSTSAYSPSTKLNVNDNKINSNRREAIAKFASATLASTAFVFSSSEEKAQALDVCSPKANNCVRTKWTPPSSTSKESAISSLKEVLSSYPQGGQADIDGGGWAFATDELGSTGLARLEYKSSGKGNFAKFFNGGKPFVDDLNLEVENTGVVQVKSQSRVGDSDFGVNAKRVDFLADALKAKGWSI